MERNGQIDDRLLDRQQGGEFEHSHCPITFLVETGIDAGDPFHLLSLVVALTAAQLFLLADFFWGKVPGMDVG
jgi:hypothetical protein